MAQLSDHIGFRHVLHAFTFAGSRAQGIQLFEYEVIRSSVQNLWRDQGIETVLLSTHNICFG